MPRPGDERGRIEPFMFTPTQPCGDSLPLSALRMRMRYTDRLSANVRQREKENLDRKNTTMTATAKQNV